jgi:alpha-glucuronidase
MANLYGFGRLAWNPGLSAGEITAEWVKMTWGDDPVVVKTISDLELKSWGVYESYTGPLGLGTLTDILHGHYGPGIETAEGNGWGQWIRADHEGIGMDRTVASGTGYIGQYSEKVAAMFESLERCPDSLLLFMHHIPYSYVLHSGKTVVQSIYDSHYVGAATVESYVGQWKRLQGKIDSDRYEAVLNRLQYQAGHAVVWRDAICNWFLKESGIPDKQGRVGHYPDRTEAEAMELHGYEAVEVTPWEDASGGKGISCPDTRTQCSATMPFQGAAGWYRVSVQYFDVSPGAAEFKVSVGEQLVKAWRSDADLPWKIPNGDTSTRELVGLIALRPGDTIRVDGKPDASDRAAVDYIEIAPVMQ